VENSEGSMFFLYDVFFMRAFRSVGASSLSFFLEFSFFVDFACERVWRGLLSFFPLTAHRGVEGGVSLDRTLRLLSSASRTRFRLWLYAVFCS